MNMRESSLKMGIFVDVAYMYRKRWQGLAL